MVRSRHTDIEIDLAADAAARAAVAELARGGGPARLEAANRLRHAAEALVTELVAEARAEGATWADIGEILGVSTQAAHQKYRWSAADATASGGEEEDDEMIELDSSPSESTEAEEDRSDAISAGSTPE